MLAILLNKKTNLPIYKSCWLVSYLHNNFQVINVTKELENVISLVSVINGYLYYYDKVHGFLESNYSTLCDKTQKK